jgi:hypothetical protein
MIVGTKCFHNLIDFLCHKCESKTRKGYNAGIAALPGTFKNRSSDVKIDELRNT